MRIPRHIGIIPDGNRRFAKQSGMEKHEGYEKGLNPGVLLVQLAKEYEIEEITFYGFTIDNLKRPKIQVDAFKKACVDAVDLLTKEGASLLVVGNSDSPAFPQELKPYTVRTDINGGGIRLNFLVNYGWEWDLSSIEAPTSGQGKIIPKLHSHDISRIDLIIRWGGMRRLSGFLPVQSVYSDFYIVDSLWPEFTPSDLRNAIEWYQSVDVTLGG